MEENVFNQSERDSVQKPGVLILLAGPTASGKSTIMKELLTQFPSLQHVISYTTRPPRDGEINGQDYHFVTAEEFNQLNQEGDILDARQYGGNFYGTRKTDLLPLLNGQSMIRIVTMPYIGEYEADYYNAFDAVTADKLTQNTLPILICPGSLRTQLRRFEKRDGNREQFRRRHHEEREILLDNPKFFPNVVFNFDGSLSQAINDVINLVEQKTQLDK